MDFVRNTEWCRVGTLAALMLARCFAADAPPDWFREDFSGGAPRWRALGGAWEVREGVYVSTAPGTAVAEAGPWEDLSVEVRLRTDEPGPNSWDMGALIFRFTPRENAFGGDYYYILLHQRANLELGKRVGGKQVKGGLAHAREVPPGTDWNLLRVVVRGRLIRVFVNGELALEAVDPEPLPAGGIALMNLGAVRCGFDDVRVSAPEMLVLPIHPRWPGHTYSFQPVSPPAAETPAPENAWPTYRGNNARTGVSSATIPLPLQLRWRYRPALPPAPAWPEPGKEHHRLDFDYATPVAVARGKVLFGSSSSHALTALRLDSGQRDWRFLMEGPVRFAPAIAGDRVYVASDDGSIACLDLADGKPLWRHREGARDERLVGNDQVISRRPCRSGVLVDGDRVYATAGMWAADGITVFALDARDGRVLWRNDTSDQIYMKLPHDYLEGIAGVSPQGYLLLCRDTLAVPNARAMPAGYDRADGRLRFCRNDASKLHHAGGAWLMACGDLILGERHPLHVDRHVTEGPSDPYPGDGLIAWGYDTGVQVAALAGKQVALHREGMLFTAGDGSMTATRMETVRDKSGAFYASGRVDPDLPPEHVHPMGWWRGSMYPWYPSQVVPVYPHPCEWETPVGRVHEMILAANVLFAGLEDRVLALDPATGHRLWEASVESQARALAVAAGHLLVSTAGGDILCFGPPGPTAEIDERSGMPPETEEERAQAAALLDQLGVREGHCLLLSPPSPALPAQLARQSDLLLSVSVPDAAAADSMRTYLADRGLHGLRVGVHHTAANTLPYADFFADAIVVPASARQRLGAGLCGELRRVLRPFGGVLLLQEPDAELRRLFATAGFGPEEMAARGTGLLLRRGPLPGAGVWTHEYGDAGRSAASAEQHLRLPLAPLWFGGPGPARMVSRHWRSPAPLFAAGRLFVAGERHVMAVNAYNGRELWCRPIPDVGRFPARDRGGNIVTDGDSVLALSGGDCLRLDAATGETLRTYAIPAECRLAEVPENPVDRSRGGTAAAEPVPNQPLWEFLAVSGDLVLGTSGVANLAMSWWPEAYPECRHLFALHRDTGAALWTYRAETALSPQAIAIEGGRLTLIDRPGRAESFRRERRGNPSPAGPCRLRCLLLETGSPLWEQDIRADLLMLWSGGGVLLASGPARFEAWEADTGKPLWQAPIRGGFPVVIGDRFYVYPGAYELRTGRPVGTTNPVTGKQVPWTTAYKGGCGTLSGCPGSLFFRSGAAGMVDLAGDSGIHWLGQARSSCWLNMIPAGGMLLMPEGASNCSCPYNYQTTVALVSDTRQETWSIVPERGVAPGDRIRALNLNFGAVGDRRDEAGEFWLAYPRPFRPGAQTVPMTARGSPRYLRRNADSPALSATEKPWLQASALTGAVRLDLDLQLHRPAAALPCETPPHPDGVLDEPCWDGREALAFTTDEQWDEERSIAFLRTDGDALTIGFRREAPRRDGKPVPWSARTRGRDAPVWDDDSLNVRLRRGSAREGLYLSVSASGASFDGKSGATIGTDKRWNGPWRYGVHRTPGYWSAELAVPWSTLEECGITPQALQIYLESTNRSGVGPERTQFRERPYTRLWCFAHPFTPVIRGPVAALDERSYDLVLQFSDPLPLAPGERIFDVLVQGVPVLRGVDVIREAGGPNRLWTRRIPSVQAGESLRLELVPVSGHPPLLNGLQLTESMPDGP
ncbi:MAG: PQQ-binding-like beta-propeller repeat protein [Lentisphaeria bacterium]|nr:PQQ-binding-like beta-propeller repeat protein [Lentisphaeria bacterium]